MAFLPLPQLAIILLFAGSAIGSISFIVIGDWGADPYSVEIHGSGGDALGTDDQARVRDKMDLWSAQNSADFIMTVGDNFYPDGVVSLDDPRWDDAWRNMYNTTNLDHLVWYATLGNHDHVIDGRYMYQVNMTYLDPNWYMPSNYYHFYWTEDDVKVHFVALDTEVITFDLFNGKQAQLEWLNETLERAEPSDWTIVYGHHPMRSCGKYAPGSFILWRDILPALEYYEVDLYLYGHDHNLQHIVRNDTTGPEYVLSGSGGKSLYDFSPVRCRELHEDGYTLEFFAERYGFVGVLVEKHNVTVHFYGDSGEDGELEVLHSFTKIKESY